MYALKVWRDPYCTGFNITAAEEVILNEGVTVLVGCNGAGKSTFLLNVKEECKKEELPFFEYNNLVDGGNNSLDNLMFFGKLSAGEFASRVFSSEGENISANLGDMVAKLSKFIATGKSPFKIGLGNDESIISNKRFILLDAVDSGYSIDNIIDLKGLFNVIIEDAKRQNVEVYIIISANEYELANGENCLDVVSGDYIKFSDYEDFKRFILKTREEKEKRYEKLEKKEE